MSKIDRADLALAFAFLSLLCTAWQAMSAWNEKDTPLQAHLFETQIATMQSLTENARGGCARRICSDYANPENEKYESCKGSRLDDAFEKVELETNNLKLIAPPRIVALVETFKEQVHDHHAFNRNDPDFKDLKQKDATDETRKFLLYSKCHRQIGEFVNEFRRVIGLEKLSDALLSKVGDGEFIKRLEQERR